MKNIVHLIGILTVVLFSNIGNAQIELTPLSVCDDNNDGYATFDLTLKFDEILNGNNPDDYMVTFHETIQDAENNTSMIGNPEEYMNIASGQQTVYFRLEHFETGDFTIGYFIVIAFSTPETGQPINLFNPAGIFDLTENIIPMTIGTVDLSFTFHLTLEDAQTGVLAIANVENYPAISSPQTIYVRAENAEGCFVIASFHLILSDTDDIVYIPDVNFKNVLLSATTNNGIAKDLTGESIKIDNNNDGEIQVSEALNVFWLNVSASNISDQTGIEYFTNLTFLNFSWNQMTSMDFSNNINLVELLVANNSILNDLTLGNLPDLEALMCYDNSLTSIDVSGLTNLKHLYCSVNLLTEIDCSNNYFLEYLELAENFNLQYLNIKNGSSLIFNLSVSGIDNLYICADEFEIENIQPLLNQWGTTGQIISTYCTFYPAGNYNTITGTILFDSNNDEVCDESDVAQPFLRLNITDGADQINVFANQEGNYFLFTQDGEYTLTAEVENPNFFNITPVTETVTFADNNNNEETVNFCVTPNGVHPDLEVVIAPINPARPGFEATYKIVYRNKGNQILSQDYGLSFIYNQHLMSFVSATVTPDTQGPGGMNWSYENLMPFENRSIIVTMQINAPTHLEYPVNIDDVLTFTSVIMPQAGDENVMDNTFIFNQTVVGSYDPNDITCIEGDVVEPEHIGEELHYVIRFENTGNYYAENVVVAMEIDTMKYDIDSVRLLNTSHNANAQIKNNVLEVFFNQIMLDSGGHGNILLVMKSVSSLSEGDSVLSKADIYFDYNYPIITNDAVTVFEAELSVNNPVLNSLISIYPNPVKDLINLTSEVNIKTYELFDISGRLIVTGIINNLEATINLSLQSSGTYFVRINTDNGSIIKKILKD